MVARIGDVAVTFAEIEDAWRRNDAASRLRMLQDLYDARRRALDIVVGERLVEREAASRGITRDELLAVELPERMIQVTDAEIDLIYERNRDRLSRGARWSRCGPRSGPCSISSVRCRRCTPI